MAHSDPESFLGGKPHGSLEMIVNERLGKGHERGRATLCVGKTKCFATGSMMSSLEEEKDFVCEKSLLSITKTHT